MIQDTMRLFVTALILCISSNVTTCFGDEIVLDEDSSESLIQLGDYECSAYRAGSRSTFPLPNQSERKHITAGELWSFFDQQGLDSVDKLIICVDIDRLPANQQVDLHSLDLWIEDSSNQDQLDRFSMGNNSLVLPASYTKSNSAECRLELNLGYDFMQKYSRASTEKLMFDIGVDDKSGASTPVFYIEGKRSWFTLSTLTLLLLVGFAFFWAVVFYVLKRFTLPTSNAKPLGTEAKVIALPSIKVAASDSAA